MKLSKLLLTALTISLAHSQDSHDEDDTTVNEKFATPEEVVTTREKKQIKIGCCSIYNPVMELMKETIAPNYKKSNNCRKPNNFFDFLRDPYPLPKGYKAPLAEYDFVIIGAGSAGSVLASRLTEDKPKSTVLLLEAGKPEMLFTDVPAIAPYFQRTDYTWPYVMEHQPGVCMGMEDQRCFWPRGRAVGGTSVINYMIYTRGRPQEWDRIAADGNYGWTYNDVLKYYIKAEKCNLKKYKNSPHRGRDGEISVEDVPFRTKLSEAFMEAGKLLGHRSVDYNAPDGFGFGYVQTTTSHGHRQSSAKAFLHPHKRRSNLHILPESHATKVLIDPQAKKAYGVQYVRNGYKYTVKARMEVILSAGPIASPQLLMLSGIGPEDHLQSLGIPVIQDLPVGRTLYDHICFPGAVFSLNTTTVGLHESKVATLDNFMQWLQFGDGILTLPGGVENLGYIKTPVSEDPELVPDIELINVGASFVADAGENDSEAVRKGMKITDETFYDGFGSLRGKDTWSIFPMLLHPKSTGYLELRDANPFSFPKIYGNYLTERKDVETLIAAIRKIITIGESPPFQKFGARLHHADLPTCRSEEFNTDEYWECAVRTLTATLHHQIATCKMGPANDSTAVVDPELRVYGIQNLRVADTSVIPRTKSAHTHAPGMMIGDKAADLIKQTWELGKYSK